jgi:hypothetical protein
LQSRPGATFTPTPRSGLHRVRFCCSGAAAAGCSHGSMSRVRHASPAPALSAAEATAVRLLLSEGRAPSRPLLLRRSMTDGRLPFPRRAELALSREVSWPKRRPAPNGCIFRSRIVRGQETTPQRVAPKKMRERANPLSRMNSVTGGRDVYPPLAAPKATRARPTMNEF